MSPKEETPKKTNPLKRIIMFVIITALFFTIFALTITIMSLNNLNCIETDYIFIREYLADYNSKNESILISCSDCLWIEAVSITNTHILGFKNNPPSNDLQKSIIKDNTKKFFFALDHELLGFNPYDMIKIKWCETSTGPRIRNVKSG